MVSNLTEPLQNKLFTTENTLPWILDMVWKHKKLPSQLFKCVSYYISFSLKLFGESPYTNLLCRCPNDT